MPLSRRLSAAMAEHRIELLAARRLRQRRHCAIRRPAMLYEDALRTTTARSPPAARSSPRPERKTGRSPKDKRIVETPDSAGDIWWGPVNIPLAPQSFRMQPQAGHRLSQHAARGSTSSTASPAGTRRIGSRSASSARGRTTPCSCTTC